MLLAVAVVCVYGIARVCAARFYGPLGVRPEDLKFGYPGLVEQSLGVVIVALVGAMTMVLLAVILAWLWRITVWQRFGWELRWKALIVTVLVLLVLVIRNVLIGYGLVAGLFALALVTGVLMLRFPQTWVVRVAPLGFLLMVSGLTWIMWGRQAMRQIGLSAASRRTPPFSRRLSFRGGQTLGGWSGGGKPRGVWRSVRVFLCWVLQTAERSCIRETQPGSVGPSASITMRPWFRCFRPRRGVSGSVYA